MKSFLDALREQRWDDHRFYHQSRINQSLHLVSAISFLCVYVLIFTDPVMAALVGWLFSMVTRQVGHFFFEPKEYDQVNAATHEYKESIKVGYNLFRKVILLSIWIATPVVLYWDPTFFGLFEPYTDSYGFLHSMSVLWISVGVGAVLFRMVHLFFLQGVQAGVVWVTKIITDPFHDIMLYWKSPFYLLRGELLDPMYEVRHA